MLYRNQNDETLVMLTLAGEQKAYEVLVTKYQKAVISAAASVTHNSFMAEDAAQDAFVTAWMKLDTLKEPQKFASWVCRIAKNCALNMLPRYRSFLSLDETIGFETEDGSLDPETEFIVSDEKSRDSENFRKTMEGLPEKVGEIIRLHYFEGLSIVEIADRMRISEGTVKSQLHDGRKRIRRELCAMDEKWNDTLVRKVMKKVEELKLWKVKNDKSGFEKAYKNVLAEVEELPESQDKSHALADVLMRGWWWIPGEKNDALFARIRQAAEDGKNEEVMEFICAREDEKVYGGARIDFIRDKQIPRLAEKGFVKALAREWFWLAREYYKTKQREKGREAYMKARSLLSPEDLYYSLALSALEAEELVEKDYKDKDTNGYMLTSSAEEFRMIDGKVTYWNFHGVYKGSMYSGDRTVNDILRNASRCDGLFFPDLKLGEIFTASDGSTLTLVSDSETVDTPAGRFENCLLLRVKYFAHWSGESIFNTYFKDGVGIVRHEHISDGILDARSLSFYKIVGGSGLLPLSVGNEWSYVGEYDENCFRATIRYKIAYADGAKAIFVSDVAVERLRYDENSWLDMIEKVRNEYCTDDNDNERICDVYDAIRRAEMLAKTPMEKVHSRVAGATARRILETDPTFNKECTATGHWNFFEKSFTRKQNGRATIGHNRRWSFEWKNAGGLGRAGDPILYNDVLGILQDAANCIWSDEWVVGAAPTVEYVLWERHKVKTDIICESCEPITTKAGTFNDCIKLTLNIGGLTDGLGYRAGKKEYYFARGIGIVKTVNHTYSGACQAVYELTKYEGEGEGYMPIVGGLFRRYDAQGLTDGYEGAVEYTFVEDDDGQVFIFSDQIGTKQKLSPVTAYGSINSEVIERQYMDEEKSNEAHQLHGINNFHLMLHYLARPAYHRNNARRSIDICSFNMNMMESFGENGKLPDAWVALYAWTALVRAAAHFGAGEKEQGYVDLETSLAHYRKWGEFKTDDLLDTGKENIFAGAKLLKSRDYEATLSLPDGTLEPLSSYDYRINPGVGVIYSVLNARGGWEWFNSVRDEERFKEYIERARGLIE